MKTCDHPSPSPENVGGVPLHNICNNYINLVDNVEILRSQIIPIDTHPVAVDIIFRNNHDANNLTNNITNEDVLLESQQINREIRLLEINSQIQQAPLNAINEKRNNNLSLNNINILSWNIQE